MYFCTFLWVQVYKPTLTRFSEAGGLACNSPAEASKGNWRHMEIYANISHKWVNKWMNKELIDEFPVWSFYGYNEFFWECKFHASIQL